MSYNWNEPGRVIRVDVMQDKARKLGISSKDIATTLNGVVGGITITQVRDSIYLIDVIVRAQKHERDSIDTLQSLQIATGNGTSVPLAAIANFRYELEQPVVYRRSRIPTITVAAGIIDKTMPDTIVRIWHPPSRLSPTSCRPVIRSRLLARWRRAARARGRLLPWCL